MTFKHTAFHRWNTTVVVVVVMVFVWTATAHSTDLDLLQLPVTSPHLCFACHTDNSPTPGNTDLNPFGLDFLENGRVWDSNLAQLNSDGDACLNGVEVGDSDGDGQPDGNVDEQSGNPGVADDCGSSNLVDEKTWDALKAMFDGN